MRGLSSSVRELQLTFRTEDTPNKAVVVAYAILLFCNFCQSHLSRFDKSLFLQASSYQVLSLVKLSIESVHLVFWKMENYPRSRVIFYPKILPVNFGTTSKYVCAGKFSGKILPKISGNFHIPENQMNTLNVTKNEGEEGLIGVRQHDARPRTYISEINTCSDDTSLSTLIGRYERPMILPFSSALQIFFLISSN